MTQVYEGGRIAEIKSAISLDTDDVNDVLAGIDGVIYPPYDDPAQEMSEADRAEFVRTRRSSSSRQSAFRSKREQWQAAYARYLLLSDTAIVCIAVGAAQYFRFGRLSDGSGLKWAVSAGVAYTASSVALVAAWIVFLSLANAGSRRVIGHLSEYRQIVRATFTLFGVVAIAAMLAGVGIARGYLAIAFPLGLMGLLISRWSWHRVAERRRVHGHCQTAMLVVGTQSAALDIATKLSSERKLGYHVVGICTPDGPADGDSSMRVGNHEIPIVGTDQSIIDAVQRSGADTVAISGTEHLSPIEIRRLLWDLEALGVDLILAPGLMDVAGQRMRTEPVAGMAMLQVAKPRYGRANALGKRLFDVCFATVALVVAAPVLIVSALAVKLSSPGPVFYWSERIGMNGRPFRMIKFRSMEVGADAKMDDLIKNSGNNAVFFKIKDDPRVTPVGRVLRKFSIDELPQFFNVLRGEMSVVGPRPQVRREVDQYDDLAVRRLHVRPGLTGLWQVSGRSDMAPADAIRLDLSYVENWSMVQDMAIIARTLHTVVIGEGAY